MSYEGHSTDNPIKIYFREQQGDDLRFDEPFLYQVLIHLQFRGADTVLSEVGNVCNYGGLYIYTMLIVNDTLKYNLVAHLCKLHRQGEEFTYPFYYRLLILHYTYPGYSSAFLRVRIRKSHRYRFQPHGNLAFCKVMNIHCGKHLLWLEEMNYLHFRNPVDYLRKRCVLVLFHTEVESSNEYAKQHCNFSIALPAGGQYAAVLEKSPLLQMPTLPVIISAIDSTSTTTMEQPLSNYGNTVVLQSIQSMTLTVEQPGWQANVISMFIHKHTISCALYSYDFDLFGKEGAPLFIVESLEWINFIKYPHYCKLSIVGPCKKEGLEERCTLLLDNDSTGDWRPNIEFSLKSTKFSAFTANLFGVDIPADSDVTSHGEFQLMIFMKMKYLFTK